MSAVSKNDFVVTAIWHDEPEVWVADSDEVPGHIAEAESKTRLYACRASDKFIMPAWRVYADRVKDILCAHNVVMTDPVKMTMKFGTARSAEKDFLPLTPPSDSSLSGTSFPAYDLLF